MDDEARTDGGGVTRSDWYVRRKLHALRLQPWTRMD